MPTSNVPTWAQSSQDPTQISLTIESVGKALIGVVGFLLVSRGMDAATATNSLQQIIDLIASSVPLVFALWHSMVAVWGLIRKIFPRLGSSTL